MTEETSSDLQGSFSSPNRINKIFIGLFLATGFFILCSTLFRFLSASLWVLLGGLLLVFALVSVRLTERSAVSLYIIIVFQLFLRLPFLLRDTYFLFEIDESFHFGLSLLLAFDPNKHPIERMVGYNYYPLMDTVTALVMKFIGLDLAIVMVKLFYGILIPIIITILIDLIYKSQFGEYSHRIATLLFVSCYRFLFFFSFYIFETCTFLFFVIFLWSILKISSIKEFDKLLYFFTAIFLSVSFLLGLWHYNGVYMGSILLFGYFTLIRNEKRKYPNRWNINDLKTFIFIFSFVVLNLFSFFSLKAGYIAFSIYFQVLRDSIPFFSFFFINTPSSWGSLIIFEIIIISFLVLAFQIFWKIVHITQQTLEYCSKSLRNIRGGYFNITLIITTVIFEIILLYASILFYVYYSASSGFRTIGDFGILTILTLNGLIHFFFLALLSFLWIQNERQKIFYFLFFAFLVVSILTFLFPPISNRTFPFRLIIYVFLFGTPLATVSLTRVLRIFQRNFLRSSFSVNRTIKNFSPNLKKIYKLCNFILLLLIMSQSIILARWEGYTTSYSLPDKDIFEMSNWMRKNLDQNDSVFIEFIYAPINAYSLIKRTRPDENQILISLYYQRNITKVIVLLMNRNITYLIFDLASEHPSFMTKIVRTHILISYGISPSLLKTFNGILPEEFKIVYSTKYLALLKVPLPPPS